MTSRTASVPKLIAALCEAFGRKPTEATFLAYEIGLQGLSVEQLNVAVTRALSECQYMPVPAELRRLGGEVPREDQAEVAWEVVLRHLHLGPYKHVDFDDGLCNAVIRSLGGWPNFCTRFSSADAEKWVRKEFCDTYRSYARVGIGGEACKPLPGLAGGDGRDGIEYRPAVQRITTGLTPTKRAPAIERTERPILTLRKA